MLTDSREGPYYLLILNNNDICNECQITHQPERKKKSSIIEIYFTKQIKNHAAERQQLCKILLHFDENVNKHFLYC